MNGEADALLIDVAGLIARSIANHKVQQASSPGKRLHRESNGGDLKSPQVKGRDASARVLRAVHAHRFNLSACATRWVVSRSAPVQHHRAGPALEALRQLALGCQR